MSYEILKSINEKKRTTTSASSNVYPKDYYVNQYDINMSLDDFRASVIEDMLWGNYHISNKNHKYNVVACKIKATDEFKDLEDKMWNFDDHFTDEWVKEHYEENKKKLKELILKVFSEPIDKTMYVITSGYCYIKRINKRTYSYTTNKDNAKKYASKEIAQSNLFGIGSNWYVEVA